jgi:tape measure domain-containing protein
MADEAVRIEVTGRIDGKIARSLRDIAKAAIEADTNLDILRQAIAGFNAGSAIKAAVNDTRSLRSEITKATTAQRALASTSTGVATGLNRAADAATRYGTALRAANTNNTNLVSGTGALRNALSGVVGLFGGIFAVGYYARAQDALTSLQNKLRSLTPDLERQVKLQDSLFDLANRTRSGIESTTDGFVRFSRAMKGASDTEVLRFTETLNKLLISAGRSTAEVSSVVIQLGQALTSGRLQGDEFRALSENLPREALEAFAKQLGVGVEELKALGSQGLITTDVLRTAFGELAAYADEQFSRTLPTIGQAITVLNNKFILFTESSSAGAQVLAKAILFIGDNLNIIIPVVAAFAGVWALVQVGKLIADFVALTSAMITLAAGVAAANAPLLLMVAAIAAIGLGIAAATGTLDDFVSWMQEDLPKAIGEWIGKIGEASTASETLDKSYSGLATNVTTATNAMGTGFTNANMSVTAANDNVQSLATNIGGISTPAASATASVVNLGSTSAMAFGQATQGANQLTSAIQETEGQTNELVAALQSVINWAGEAAAAVGRAIQAAAAFMDDLSGADGSAAFQIGDRRQTATQTPAFDNGGSMVVSGRSGVDKNLVSFRASNGERIDVKTAAQQRAEEKTRRGDNDDEPRGAPTYIFNIETPDADSFRLSRTQVSSAMFGATG